MMMMMGDEDATEKSGLVDFRKYPQIFFLKLTSRKEEACRDGETTTTQQKQMAKLFYSNRKKISPPPKEKKEGEEMVIFCSCKNSKRRRGRRRGGSMERDEGAQEMKKIMNRGFPHHG